MNKEANAQFEWIQFALAEYYEQAKELRIPRKDLMRWCVKQYKHRDMFTELRR